MPSPPQTRTLKPAKEGGQPPKQTLPRKRQPSGRISAACEACKKRKTKCTGGPAPCQLCESLGTECVIDLTLDMRRRAALQRTIDESKSYQESLAGLLECLRDGDSMILGSLTESLRRHPSPQELSAIIHNLIQNIRDREGDSSVDEPLPSPSEESVEGLRVYHQVPRLVVSREPSFDRSSTGTATSPSGGHKGKGLEGAGQYHALLQQLRVGADVDSERILRKLIDPDELVDLFRQSARKGGSVQTGARDLVAEHGGSVASSSPNEDRSRWHPALQLRQDSPQSQRSTERDEVLAPGSTFQVVSRVSGSLIQPGSRGSSVVHSANSPVFSMQQKETGMRSPQDLIFQATQSSARQPYTELSSMPIRSGDTDLCIAQENSTYRWRVPIHLVLPLTIPDGSSMSRVYTEYLQAARQMISAGDPVATLLGPNDDIVVDLLFRQRRSDDRWDCSSWACELLRSFTEHDISVRLANAFFLTRMMRWLLVPSLENYMKLPDLMKPTSTQRQVPHIGAIDLIPIPCIREAVIANLRDWLTPLGEARWSVNWPFSDQDALKRDPATGSTRLTSRFMKHVERYENWSVGSSFLTAFPEVAGKVNIHLS